MLQERIKVRASLSVGCLAGGLSTADIILKKALETGTSLHRGTIGTFGGPFTWRWLEVGSGNRVSLSMGAV
jgi:hypothetical protein